MEYWRLQNWPPNAKVTFWLPLSSLEREWQSNREQIQNFKAVQNQVSLTLLRGENRTFTDHLKRSLINPRQMSTSVAFCILWTHICLGLRFYCWQLKCGLRVDIWATKEWTIPIFKVKHSNPWVLFSILLSASITTVLLKSQTYGQKKGKIWKKSAMSDDVTSSQQRDLHSYPMILTRSCGRHKAIY